MSKYEVGQKLEVYGLPELGLSSADSLNRDILVVIALPGFDSANPSAYAATMLTGRMKGEKVLAEEAYVRPYPPKLPNGRYDIDQKSTWEQLEKATGISADVVKNGRPTSDY